MNNAKAFNSKEYLLLLSENTNCVLREDTRIEVNIKKNLEAEYAKQRERVHASDLTLCLRQSLFRKISPIAPTQKAIGYFVDGSRRHETLQKLNGSGVAEKEVEFEGVKCTIDILDNGVPIEFKTTRAKNAISEHWIRQLIFYMLAVNSPFGILQIQRIMPSKGKQTEEENLFPAYLIELNLEQRTSWLADFRQRKDKFLSGLISSDPARVPVYRGEGDWLCTECQYKNQCNAIEGIAA
jgi:hypothetical protein